MIAFSGFLAAYVLSQFFRSFLAVIAPELSHELALDPQSLAGMQTAWIVGFSLMQFPVGWALDMIGPRRTVTSLMMVAVIGSILFARAASGFDLYVAMALIGIGCSSIYMGAIFVLGRMFSPGRFALLCSWLIGLGSAGNLIAASPLAWAVTLIGWRMAMLGIAGLTVVAALTLFFLVKDPERHSGSGHEGFFKGLTTIFSIRALWPILPLTTVSYAILLAERGLWAGPYLSETFGLGPVDRGNALLVMAGAMSLGALVYGPLDHVFGGRKPVVALGTAASAACFLGLALAPVPVLCATLLLAGIGAFGMTYGVLMAHGRAFVPDRLLGRGITVMNILFIGGAAIVQPISGVFMNQMKESAGAGAYATLHLSFAVVLLAALAVYLFAPDAPTKKPHQET